MSDQMYFIPTPRHHITIRATAQETIAWLTGIYGNDPREVGAIDGREDDLGDLISADLPFAVLGYVPDVDDVDERAYERLMNDVTQVPTWTQALALARNHFAGIEKND